MNKEYNPTPLETGECEPVWIGDEESHYVPIGEEGYYNTSIVCFIKTDNTAKRSKTHYRKVTPEYQKFIALKTAWNDKYADYNGITTERKERAEQQEDKRYYYTFNLGKKGLEKARAFIEKMEGVDYEKKKVGKYSYRYIIYPSPVGDSVNIEAYRNLKNKDIEIIAQENIIEV